MFDGARADASVQRGRISAPIAILIIASVFYVGALVALDARRNVFDRVTETAAVLPVLALASLASYFVRFIRWHKLLVYAGHTTPKRRSFLAYLAGFTFTASPGKAGELVRIRYFSKMGVPHNQVVACFIFERLIDLITLLILASPIAGKTLGFTAAASFVAIVLSLAVALAKATYLPKLIQHKLRTAGYRSLAKWVRVLFTGAAATAQFATWRRLGSALLLGLAAWSIQCLGFAAALSLLGISMPGWILFAIPPAAVLIGAASMMPGGVGTTEVATVVLLTHFGADFDRAVLAAIALRLGSIWFATIVGFSAMMWLERKT